MKVGGKINKKKTKKSSNFCKALLFCYIVIQKINNYDMFTKNTFCRWVCKDYAQSQRTRQEVFANGEKHNKNKTHHHKKMYYMNMGGVKFGKLK